MMRLRTTSIATAVTMFLTTFVPAQAVQMPAQPTMQTTSAETIVPVQYRERDRRNWGNREMRRRPPPRHGWYNGHRGYREHRRGYRQHNGYWFPLAAFATGAIIGGAVQSRPSHSYGNNHASWCANRWRSYRAYDNSYQPSNGSRRACVSPYR